MNSSFAQDLQNGLSSSPKFVSSKYFYDAEGSRLFQKIMELPEYYLTRCEFEIFERYRAEMGMIFGKDTKQFELIEFGAGDGTKTAVLLDYLVESSADFSYIPIDISPEILLDLSHQLKYKFPKLSVQALQGEYFEVLNRLEVSSNKRKVVLFLGSNIGNFTHSQAIEFLRNIRRNLQKNDLILIGFDLRKKPQIILDAYNDSQGVTRQFNLNLLHRINQEFGGNIQVENFEHFPVYNPLEGCAKSYLVSSVAQHIYLEKLHFECKMEAWEAIHTEVSHKYSFSLIKEMAKSVDCEVVNCFTDSRQYFVDAIWEVL